MNRRTAMKWTCGGIALLGCGAPDAGEDEPVATVEQNIDEDRFGDYKTVIPKGTLRSGPALLNVDGNMNHLEVYGVGRDNWVWFASRTAPDAAWTGWYQLAGSGLGFIGRPAVTMYGGPTWQPPLRRAVVATGHDGNLAISVTNSSTGPFQPWVTIPNAGPVEGAPAITFQRPYLFVMVRRTDGKYYWARNDTSAGFDNSRWSAWKQVPNGVFQSGPALTSNSTHIVVAGRGMDNRIYLSDTQYVGDAWSGWKQAFYDTGAKTFSLDPAITFHGSSVEVASHGRGSDGGDIVYVSTVNPTTGWASEWVEPGGTIRVRGLQSPGLAAVTTSATGKLAVAVTFYEGQVFMSPWQ